MNLRRQKWEKSTMRKYSKYKEMDSSQTVGSPPTRESNFWR